MKKNIIIVILLILLLGAGYLLYQNSQSQNSSPTPSLTQQAQVSPTQVNVPVDGYCIPSQLAASMDPEIAAGNLYATITLQNTSDAECKVIGNNTLEVGYPDSVTNFKTDTKGQASTPVFTLKPNQTIYSLIHYPNGPQCSSEATQVDAMVSYAISPKDTVSFKPATSDTLSIPSCGSDSDITMVDLYPFSTSEVTPQ